MQQVTTQYARHDRGHSLPTLLPASLAFPDASRASRARNGTAALPASGNRLLDALPAAQYRMLEQHLELVPLPVGRVLSEPNDRLTHVYFPTTVIVSLLMPSVAGLREEVAMTGNEGMIGISAFLEGSGGAAPVRCAVVQHAGQAWRLPAGLLAEQFYRYGDMQRLLLRYTQAFITQVAQTAVCNRHHRIAQQLCRWLLLRLDRLPGYEIPATHEQVAKLLGVRRESITAAVVELKRAELIQLKRGRVTVLDRPGLEQAVCECYAVIRKEYARLLEREQPRLITARVAGTKARA